uniref:Tho2 domain-containing protein n=1 Tax=Steinernema glaseri TaxID=37863 RepID=A0A1I7ZDM0_9BILA
MIAKRKDMVQTVYNWQFIQSLYLWCEVICKASKYHSHETDYRSIEELAFPFTQVVTATMRLFPSAKLLPLRLHCVRLFVQLQKYCDIFIPSLQYCAELLDDVLEMTMKKPKTKNGNFVGIWCILKASDALMGDAVYRKAVSDGLYEQMLKSAYQLASQSGFPDVIVPFDAKIRVFLKKCRSPVDKTTFKSLLTVLRTHAEHVRMVIMAKQVDLNDEASLSGVHLSLKVNSPLITFYNDWTKQMEAQREALQLAEKSAEEETKRMEAERKKKASK